MIEVLVAILVLSVGILGTVVAMSSSRELSSTAQIHQLAVGLAVEELQHLEAQPYEQIALKTEPEHSTIANNPRYYLSACSGTKCKEFQWEQGAAASAATIDPLVINSAATEASIDTIGPTTHQFASRLSNGTEVKLEVYRFYTWVKDEGVCKGATVCGGADSYKRITVAVENAGNTYPKNPIVLSTIVAAPVGTHSPLSELECESEHETQACSIQ